MRPLIDFRGSTIEQLEIDLALVLAFSLMALCTARDSKKCEYSKSCSLDILQNRT